MHFMAEQRRIMVERQLKARGITSDRLLAAFDRVPREAFVPDSLAEFAYSDMPLPIGEGQTISQPYIVALMIDAAAVQANDRALEIGTGSGYAAALLAELAGEVVTIERHACLADAARARLAAVGYERVTVLAGDGSRGLPGSAPFDVILVPARSEQVPASLLAQLAPGGRLVMPVGPDDCQSLRLVTRVGAHDWREVDLAQVRFVPLIEGQGLEAASDQVGLRNAAA